jgi:hypothetical protein
VLYLYLYSEQCPVFSHHHITRKQYLTKPSTISRGVDAVNCQLSTIQLPTANCQLPACQLANLPTCQSVGTVFNISHLIFFIDNTTQEQPTNYGLLAYLQHWITKYEFTIYRTTIALPPRGTSRFPSIQLYSNRFPSHPSRTILRKHN